MGEETSKTVKTTSDGAVTISVERYQELLDKSAAKAPVVHKTVQKTPTVAASDNKVWGVSFMGVGAAIFIVGAIRFGIGRNQAAKL